MRRFVTPTLILAAYCLWAGIATAQSQVGESIPDVISKSTKAVGYPVGGGSTKVDLKSTSLMPQASGEAKVEAQKGITNVEVDIKGMAPASKLGTEFLTYVLWTVSPDGRTVNIGELQIDKNGAAQLKATTQLQTFSLIVTAEPYFSVRVPSELVGVGHITAAVCKFIPPCAACPGPVWQFACGVGHRLWRAIDSREWRSGPRVSWAGLPPSAPARRAGPARRLRAVAVASG